MFRRASHHAFFVFALLAFFAIAYARAEDSAAIPIGRDTPALPLDTAVQRVASNPPAPGSGEKMEMGQAIILGLVEGVTEFLPISSTGHLILTGDVLDLARDEQARDLSGQLLWKKKPDPATGFAGEPFTVKAATDTYAVVIQAGAIAAVVVIYWRTIIEMIAGLFGLNPRGLRLIRNLLVAFLPAAVLGLLFNKPIDRYLFSTWTVVAALVVGAGLMLWADRKQKARSGRMGGHELTPSELSVWQCVLIGTFQCFAMWPGMSRSMMVILGGYVAGLRPARAAEFSFLLGLVTLTAAAGYKALGTGKLVVAAFGLTPLAVGCLVAAVSAAISVRWLVGYLNRHGLALFAWYRIVLAGVVVWLLV